MIHTISRSPWWDPASGYSPDFSWEHPPHFLPYSFSLLVLLLTSPPALLGIILILYHMNPYPSINFLGTEPKADGILISLEKKQNKTKNCFILKIIWTFVMIPCFHECFVFLWHFVLNRLCFLKQCKYTEILTEMLQKIPICPVLCFHYC